MSTSSADLLEKAKRIDSEARLSLIKPDPLLDHAITNSAAKGLPEITISDLQGQYLGIQAQLINAKTVLEIGTLRGYSTIWLARTGAKVTSIELDSKHREVALENTKGLDVEIILGVTLDVLPKLAAEGYKFDFIFIDAAWEEQWQYFQWAVKLANKNGCIYVDNVIREVLENEGMSNVSESLLARVGRERSVVATLVPTISSHKGKTEEMYDGFLLAVVRGTQ